MTNDELKAALMGDMEAEIDELVRERGSNGKMTLTEIEDVVLTVRQRLGQKLAERLIEAQEQARGAAIPVSPVTGKRMHPKGKKTRP